MTQGTYGQFCPVAMASEIVCTRWTLLVLRELISGTTRFNDLRRDAGVQEYHLTEAGRELAPIVESLGAWGQRWVESELSLQRLDAQLLMWDMRRNLNTDPMPEKRCVVQFQFADQPSKLGNWWVIVEPGYEVDLCGIDPGHDVDLYVATDLRTMTAIWMGYETVRAALSSDRLFLTGSRPLASKMQAWLGLSPLAKFARKAS